MCRKKVFKRVALGVVIAFASPALAQSQPSDSQEFPRLLSSTQRRSAARGCRPTAMTRFDFVEDDGEDEEDAIIFLARDDRGSRPTWSRGPAAPGGSPRTGEP